MIDPTIPTPTHLDVSIPEAAALGAAIGSLLHHAATGTDPVALTSEHRDLVEEHLKSVDHARMVAVCLAGAIAQGTRQLGCSCGQPICDGRVQFATVDFRAGTTTITEPEDIPEPARTIGRLIGAMSADDVDTAQLLTLAVPSDQLQQVIACTFSMAIALWHRILMHDDVDASQS